MLTRSALVVILLAVPLYGEEDFYKALMALTTQSTKMPSAFQKELESKEYDPLESLCGVKFGMSMTEVVKVWGKPNYIWMQQLNNITQLDIRHCNFKFKGDRLIGIGINSASLPGLKLKDGLSFKSTEADIKKKYANAQQTELGGIARILTVELKNGLTMRLQFGIDKLIAITFDTEN